MRWMNRLTAALLVVIALPASAPARGAGTDDWDKGNAGVHGDFLRAEPGALPEGWELVAPNPPLAPRFGLVRDGNSQTVLQAEGNGRLECFGYLRHKVRLEGGKTYRMRARFDSRGWKT